MDFQYSINVLKRRIKNNMKNLMCALHQSSWTKTHLFRSFTWRDGMSHSLHHEINLFDIINIQNIR